MNDQNPPAIIAPAPEVSHPHALYRTREVRASLRATLIDAVRRIETLRATVAADKRTRTPGQQVPSPSQQSERATRRDYARNLHLARAFAAGREVGSAESRGVSPEAQARYLRELNAVARAEAVALLLHSAVANPPRRTPPAALRTALVEWMLAPFNTPATPESDRQSAQC